MTTTGSAVTAEDIRTNLVDFIERQAKAPVAPDLDLFGSGLVSSLFALQLVMQVESAFRVTVEAGDLKLDNFRTVDAITGLVLRLRGAGDG
jgi:methoxymalonate biosynthesis acyl carrier protein